MGQALISNESLSLVFADFSARHSAVFDAYKDLTEKNDQDNLLAATLKKLWFDICLKNDSFNADDRKIADFMKQSVKSIPIMDLKSDEKQVLTDLLERYEQLKSEEPLNNEPKIGL